MSAFVWIVILMLAMSSDARPERVVDPAGDMAYIEAGAFTRRGVVSAAPPRFPDRQVSVPAFLLDVREVTVGRYRSCVRAGARACPVIREIAIGYSGGHDCSWPIPGRDDHPMDCVAFTDAAPFCKWARKRLPTDVEWQFAAENRGRSRFPWGDAEPDASRVCRREETSCAVGARPLGASSDGVEDLVGNVLEWTSCSDAQAAGADALCPSNAHAWVRGGSFDYSVEALDPRYA